MTCWWMKHCLLPVRSALQAPDGQAGPELPSAMYIPQVLVAKPFLTIHHDFQQ
jgi:hypothetical protein